VISVGWKIENKSFVEKEMFTIEDYNLLLKLFLTTLLHLIKNVSVNIIKDKKVLTTLIIKNTSEKRMLVKKNLENTQTRAKKCVKCS
jgi:hypothetical protein